MAPSPGITCAYCGGRHANAAEVRECWLSHSEGTSALAPPTPGPLGVASAVPGAASAARPDQAAHLVSGRTAGARRPALGEGCLAPVLGRSVLVAPGQAAPDAWLACPRVDGTADDVEELEAGWRGRVARVVELGEEPAVDEVERAPVWSLPPSYAFPGERRAHAVFSNAIDARGEGPARWPLAQRAAELGATVGGPADVVLADGTPAYCDGGPLEWMLPGPGTARLHRVGLMAGSLAPFGDNATEAALAPDQLAAVLCPQGTARIIAPAGSGKTRVLTERARLMLRAWRLPSRAVTLVAFNKRAAEEMSERAPDLPGLQVRTLNALGLSLLTSLGNGGRGRPGPGPSTIDERAVRDLLGTLVDLPRRANVDPAVAWIEALSAVRLGLESPTEVEADFDGDVDGLPEVFDRYRRLLADRGLVDFDEQVYRAIELLLTDPGARQVARAGCRVLLVDEFQDLTPAHLLLVRLLAGPDGAVFGVGDDDQTIYGYTGASPEWLIDYSRYFPGAAAHPLEVNYRCPVAVVGAAANLLRHNRRRVAKSIVARPGRAPVAGELSVMCGEDPVALTLDAVAARLASGAPAKDVAVLTRVNASLAPVQVSLVTAGIPVRPAVDATYLARGGVQAALAWLRLAVAPADRLKGPDVGLAARRPSRSLSPRVVEWMSDRPSMARLERLAERLKDRDADKVRSFIEDLARVRVRAASGTTAQVLRVVRDQVGLDQAMELLEGSRRHLDRSAQTDDLDALVALAALHPAPRDFEAWLRAALEQAGSPDGVVLSTVHRVKGREWPHVVVHDASAGLLPHRLASDMEEERRIFHVALTRGSSTVIVVAGEAPSPFLAELTGAAPAPAPVGFEAGAAGASARPLAPPRPSGSVRPSAPARSSGSARAGGSARPSATARASGRQGPAVPPEVSLRVRDALRAWRSARAAKERKPPYIYLHDRTIDTLAAEAPATLLALSRADGIGPAKLSAYGDELLAVIAAARDSVGGSRSP